MSDIMDKVFELEAAIQGRNNMDKIPELLLVKLSSEIDRLCLCDKDQFEKVQGGVEQLRSMLQSITGSRGEINVTI